MNESSLEYKLKREIHRLKQENKKLRSNIRTFNHAFKKTEHFLRDYIGKFSVEQAISAAELDVSMEEYEEFYLEKK